jgi:hypothetical protein
MMKKKLLRFLIFFFVVAVGVFIGLLQKNNLEKDHMNTVGSIFDVETGSKSPDVFAKFSFQINGKEFESNSSIQCPKVECFQFLYKLLKGRSLVVIYEKDNPQNCEMLFRREEYEKYKLEITPDQLSLINSIDSIVKASN